MDVRRTTLLGSVAMLMLSIAAVAHADDAIVVLGPPALADAWAWSLRAQGEQARPGTARGAEQGARLVVWVEGDHLRAETSEGRLLAVEVRADPSARTLALLTLGLLDVLREPPVPHEVDRVDRVDRAERSAPEAVPATAVAERRGRPDPLPQATEPEPGGWSLDIWGAPGVTAHFADGDLYGGGMLRTGMRARSELWFVGGFVLGGAVSGASYWQTERHVSVAEGARSAPLFEACAELGVRLDRAEVRIEVALFGCAVTMEHRHLREPTRAWFPGGAAGGSVAILGQVAELAAGVLLSLQGVVVHRPDAWTVGVPAVSFILATR
ncbi:MAG: hypothetical protein AB8I08_16390 [Sandaracinaceae bacterium]